jgi:hypothetical protein
MGNRVWLTLNGMALLGVGGAALIESVLAPHRPILTGGASRWMAHSLWFWPSAASGSLAVAMLGSAWLAAQWRRRSLRRLAMGDARAGATRMAARVATRAIVADVISYPGVRRVRPRLSGSARRPAMRVRVMCDADADLGELAWRIRDDAMVRLRTTLNRTDLGGVIDFRVKRADPDRGRRVI